MNPQITQITVKGKTERKHSHKKAQKAQNEISGRNKVFIQTRFQKRFLFAPFVHFCG
jgi:hypothetical protein